MFNQNRDELRLFYVETWRKAKAGLPLQPMEQMVADVIADHPEYQGLLEDSDKAVGREFLPEDGETNPFMHMGLHIAIREQVQADRPAGIAQIHARLTRLRGGPVEAEHAMMDCLAEALWQSQRHGTMPDEAAYLQCLKGLIAK